jgi:hypothetical protein
MSRINEVRRYPDATRAFGAGLGQRADVADADLDWRGWDTAAGAIHGNVEPVTDYEPVTD